MAPKAKKSTKPKIEVLHEYPAVGRYRVRVIKRNSGNALDIREYVVANNFEGFTRRGISLTTAGEVERIRDCLSELLERNVIPVEGESES